MPTGVALADPRDQLFAAAEQVLARHGASALTSRAVTNELGVAKGVLHRHFADFDTFLAELVRLRIRALDGPAVTLRGQVGRSTVVANLSAALIRVFDPVDLAVVSLVVSRDVLRSMLRETTPVGIPLLAEATTMLASYLAAEQAAGRLRPSAEAQPLALALVGTGHLLFAGELGATPDQQAVEEVVASVAVGALT